MIVHLYPLFLYFCDKLEEEYDAMDHNAFRVDIDRILRDKSPRYYNKIPKFLINWLKRTLHQDDINGILERNQGLEGVAFMRALIDKEFKLMLQTRGEESIPDEGRFIFASNHPLGGLDGICLSAILGEKYNGKIQYLVNDVLYYIDPLKPIFVPINKYGSQAKDSARAINEAYASDTQIITFPAGLCSRKQKGLIRDPEWMKSFIIKAVEYKRDVIPVHFAGRNSNFFYNFANLRKSSGIKFNVELIYLPDEMFKNSNKSFTITFGKPIPYQMFDKSKTPAEWAQYVKDVVYSMA
ncbi:Lysophospholipid Acyltransferases [Proteiniphilum saccharofermentans]|uniref:Lysophospholipid Acyltransferases n=2 Tax=Proteiniphilum saccharofermentans TaxID=1642647 RepID=A0A1R3SSL6_9BACT|nr:Lysophospholipid Acyltransferases [Proteiniphilum saccharofermentans]